MSDVGNPAIATNSAGLAPLLSAAGARIALIVAFSIGTSTLKKKNEVSMLLAEHGQYVIFIAALIWKKQFVPPVARPSQAGPPQSQLSAAKPLGSHR